MPMRSTSSRFTQSNAGFSLLEVLVAMAILGIALAALYQSAAGATRNVRADERYAYAVELARSLLANHARVPAKGINEQGETQGEFRWQVASSPIAQRRGAPGRASLHDIDVSVSWNDGGRRRQVVLNSVVEVGLR